MGCFENNRELQRKSGSGEAHSPFSRNPILNTGLYFFAMFQQGFELFQFVQLGFEFFCWVLNIFMCSQLGFEL
jgi:hypothetical protein